MDNVSPQALQSFSGFLQSLRQIVGPASQSPLYAPIIGPIASEDAVRPAKVPVWLCWIACGMGGRPLLDSKTPKEIVFVDAVAAPQFCEPPSLANKPQQDNDSDDDDDKAIKAKEAVTDAAGDPRFNGSTAASRAKQRGRAATTPDAVLSSACAMPTWGVGHRVRI